MKYTIVTKIGLTNWYIEQYIKECSYCKLLQRKFTVYSKYRFSEWELLIDIPISKVIFLKHNINKILYQKYKQKCRKFYKIKRARE